VTDSVAVTGVGVCSPLGQREEYWSGLLSGRSAFTAIDRFDASSFVSDRAAVIQDVDVASADVPAVTAFALTAAQEALTDAAVDVTMDGASTGVYVGTTLATRPSIEPRRGVEPAPALPTRDFALLCRPLVERFNLGGPAALIPTGCAAGNHAIGYAAHVVASGRADRMLAGGAEELSWAIVGMFSRLGALSPSTPRPFDSARDGVLMGEGAVFLLLERASSALARGARIYGLIAGYANVSDAHNMTAPHPQGRGAQYAMRRALEMSAVDAHDVDFICGHGTATRLNDVAEARAVHGVFANAGLRVPVTSIKGAVGHTLGAASAMSCVAVLLAMRDSIVPATTGCETPDPDCALNVVLEPREQVVRTAMCNAFGFGGSISSLILRRR
jgi:3-oxoacyl-[acyl-carrier-protein] synthase II